MKGDFSAESSRERGAVTLYPRGAAQGPINWRRAGTALFSSCMQPFEHDGLRIHNREEPEERTWETSGSLSGRSWALEGGCSTKEAYMPGRRKASKRTGEN